VRLATLAEYRRLVYAEGSAPTLNTLRRRIKDIPGGRIELGRYYVDLDAYDRVNHVRRDIDETRERLRNNPLLKGLI
jgi:hypothetical protein